ncbi:hypothetical protein GTY82_29735 [Streptomyces sp. SID5476]|nr:hypothetical protein [Streptomyces sp. SID5476]
MQRLTTAPPWRHAPRFFLYRGQVANPGASRGVSGQKHVVRLSGSGSPDGGTPWRSAYHRRTTPYVCRRDSLVTPPERPREP